MWESIEPQVNQKEPLITLHALVGISTPQTTKFMGYIKHRKVIVLIEVEVLTFLFINEWQKKPTTMFT